MHGRLFSTGALVAVAALLSLPATAPARGRSISFSFLLSKARNGGFPNGPSRNGVVAGDKRISSFMAYESDASNIVRGTNTFARGYHSTVTLTQHR